MTSAWLKLQRNLLYTAVTWAEGIVVLVGSGRALAMAVRTQGAGRRHTALPDGSQSGQARTVVALRRPLRRSATGIGQAYATVRHRVRPAGRSR
jgi:hypothetical protein